MSKKRWTNPPACCKMMLAAVRGVFSYQGEEPANETFGSGNLLLTSYGAIWGAAFVAQDVAADSLGSFTFNGLRDGAGRVGDAAGDRRGPKGPKTGRNRLAGDDPVSAQNAADRRRVLRRHAGAGQRLQQMGIATGTGAGKGGSRRSTSCWCSAGHAVGQTARGWYGCRPSERGRAVSCCASRRTFPSPRGMGC